MAKITVILGAQWGDEGKGKLVDILAKDFSVIGRATGGANAGHTVVVDGKKYVFHLLPSGMLHESTVCVIGNGVVIHLETMFEELSVLKAAGIKLEGRLLISDRASLLFDYHKVIDGLQEERKGDKKVGTTKRGIGPCYMDKIARSGLRVCDLVDFETFEKKYREQVARAEQMYGFTYENAEEELKKMKEWRPTVLEMMRPTAVFLHEAREAGKAILVEGANGAMLDIDHGTYPFVTSSNATVGGVCTGLGLPPKALTEIIGIVKAYTTRVGAGPFPTELLDSVGDTIRNKGGEFGSTTGRPRRCGWFDGVQMKYSHMINQFDAINLTKLDVLSGLKEVKLCRAYMLDGKEITDFPTRLEDVERVQAIYDTFPGWEEELSGCKTFEELPDNAKSVVLAIESMVGVPVKYIGTGPARDQMLFR